MAGEARDLERRLNEIGAEGWDLVTGQLTVAHHKATGQLTQSLFAVFRRSPLAALYESAPGRKAP